MAEAKAAYSRGKTMRNRQGNTSGPFQIPSELGACGANQIDLFLRLFGISGLQIFFGVVVASTGQTDLLARLPSEAISQTLIMI